MRISSAMSRNTIPKDHLVHCSCLTDKTVPGTQSSLNFSPRQLSTTNPIAVAIILVTCTVYSFHNRNNVRSDVKRQSSSILILRVSVITVTFRQIYLLGK
jgi:hypothetical protein